MIIRIHFFGTLARNFPEYDQSIPMEIEIPDGSMVRDLLDHIGLNKTDGIIVIIDSVLTGPEYRLSHGMHVKILQSMAGG